MNEIQMNQILPDIPRMFTALAEWLACMQCILEVKRRLSGWKLAIVSVGALIIQSCFLSFTKGLDNFWWILSMAAAIVLMYVFIYICCDMNRKDTGYYCVRAFVVAEFSASLEWQIDCYLNYVMGWKSIWLSTFCLVIVYGLVYYIIWRIYHKVTMDSINLPYVFETDGPTAVNSFFTGKRGTAFTAPLLVAATWNKELASEFGDRLGQELVDYGFTGWYGSAMNIHRTAFSGRNFEYYSEDAFLSGKIAACEVAATREHGIITYIKHFALNDSETDRAKGICTWSTEQAIREIYLKPFEMAVKEGNSNGIMNSKNGIGSKWVGSNPELLINVLRGEWGFNGAVMTDSLDTVSGYYQDPNEAVRTGTDKMLAFTVDEGYWYDESVGTITALRNAAHNVLYTLANSNAMDIKTGIPTWVMAFGVSDTIIVLLLAIWEVIAIRRVNHNKENTVDI